MLTQYKGGPVYGGTFPALLWKAFTQAALEGTPKRNWGPPAAGLRRRDHDRSRDGQTRRSELPARASGRDGVREDAERDVRCTGTVIPTPEVTSDTAHQAQLTIDRAGLLPHDHPGRAAGRRARRPRVRTDARAG
jgi:hypothetical protein